MCTNKLSQQQRVAVFVVACVLSVALCVTIGYVVGTYIAAEHGGDSDSGAGNNTDAGAGAGQRSMPTVQPSSAPSSTAPTGAPSTSSPSSTPTSAPIGNSSSTSSAATNGTDGSTSTSPTSFSEFVDTVTPWGLALCIGALTVIGLCCVWYRRQRARGEDCWPHAKHQFQYAHVISPPRPAVEELVLEPPARGVAKFDASTIDVAAEQAEAEYIRRGLCEADDVAADDDDDALIPAWRLTDVKEEDIDMTCMPEIRAIHYGLSPGEVLGGSDDDDDNNSASTLRIVNAAHDEDAEVNDTLVL